jgi:hypothetical protein
MAALDPLATAEQAREAQYQAGAARKIMWEVKTAVL